MNQIRYFSSLMLSFFALVAFPSVSLSKGERKQFAPNTFNKTNQDRSHVQKAKRVISLHGTLTEIMFALDVGNRIVGRDKTSYYPPKAKDIPSVGYKLRLNTEGILRLKPDLVLAMEGIRPRAVIEQLKLAHVPLLLFKSPQDFASAKKLIQELGVLFHKEKKAQQLITSMSLSEEQLHQLVKQRKDLKKKRVLFLYIRGHRKIFVFGKQTSIDSMLDTVGAENAVRFSQYKPLSIEALVASKPEVILVFEKGIRSIGGIKGLMNLPGVKYTPAGKQKRVVIMDDLLLGAFGPRSASASLELFRGIYKHQGVYISKHSSEKKSVKHP